MTDLRKIGIHDPSFEFLTVEQMVRRGLIERPLDGNHGEIHPKGEDFVPTGVPFIMASDLQDGVVNYVGCKFITERQANSLRKGFARNEDVLLTHKATIGRTAIVHYDKHPFVMLTPQVTYYRVKDRKRLNNLYLRNYFDSPFFQETLSSWAGAGATRAYLGITDQAKLPVVLPPKEKQDKIAAILSAYDDLIENNRRRIALLEKMAEEIYCEWFVRLRFPGHEQAKFEKGLPVGWGYGELRDVALESSRSARPGNHLSDRLYVPLDLLATREMIPADHQNYLEAQSSLVTFEENDILFGAMRPYLHKVALAPFKGITRTTCFVIRPRVQHAHAFLFLTLFQASSIDYASMICNGADRPYVVWNRGMEKMGIICPDAATLQRFETIAGPILERVKQSYFLLRHLKTSRDALLPRLISGKLPVDGLDIRFPPSMQLE